MRSQIRVFDAVELWRRPPGSVAPWVSWSVGLAVVVTLAAAVIGPHALGRYLVGHADRVWLVNGLAIGVALALAGCLAVRGRLARIVHVAVLLPVIHVVVMIVAWELWQRFQVRMPQAQAWSPYTRSLPAIESALVAGTAIVVAAWVHAAISRRVSRVWQGVVMASLLGLLFLGLWIPVAAQLWSAAPEGYDVIRNPDHWGVVGMPPVPAWLPIAMIAPPVVLATIAAVAFERWPAALHHALRGWPALLGTAVGAVVLLRGCADDGALILYTNFIHVLMAAAVLAVLSIVALGGASLIATARSRALFAHRTLTGTIAGATRPVPEVVARVEVASWLRGPRIVTVPFAVVTPIATLPVPPGIEIVAPLPAVTTKLGVGESAALLVAGDRVRLAGYVEPPAGHPYRGASAPVPGPHGAFVEPIGGEPAGGFTGLALAVWRPCVSYLLTVAAIGLVAVAGSL